MSLARNYCEVIVNVHIAPLAIAEGMDSNEVSQELDWRDFRNDDYDQQNITDEDETQVTKPPASRAATQTTATSAATCMIRQSFIMLYMLYRLMT